jgi:DnaJ-class molecular chaperone
VTAPRDVRDRLPDEWVRCPRCWGRAVTDSGPCSFCNGLGEVLREDSVRTAMPVVRRAK